MQLGCGDRHSKIQLFLHTLQVQSQLGLNEGLYLKTKNKFKKSTKTTWVICIYISKNTSIYTWPEKWDFYLSGLVNMLWAGPLCPSQLPKDQSLHPMYWLLFTSLLQTIGESQLQEERIYSGSQIECTILHGGESAEVENTIVVKSRVPLNPLTSST